MSADPISAPTQDTDRTLALAGVFQSAALVSRIAKTGMVPQDSFEASIRSLFVFDPDCAADVFRGAAGVQLGLKSARDIIGHRQVATNQDLLRYALNLIGLERRLSGRNEMIEHMAGRLNAIQRKVDHFSALHENVISSIAALYVETIGLLGSRIQVTGNPRHLGHAETADKVRALLLAGIRAAVLWRQLGGRRWHLVFRGRRTMDCIEAWLKEAN